MQNTLKTLPAHWYTDPKHFELERQTLFKSEWLYAADARELVQAGDYLTFDLAGYPLALVMGADEKIRGFHNVCRHRAASLLIEKKGSLTSTSMTCRYHGWTYDLTGSLMAAPYFDTKELKSSCEVSLFDIQVGVYNSMVFVNLDPKAPPLLTAIQPVRDEIAQSGYAIQEYTQCEEMTKGGEFNWKVWMDGFQECYHCATIHPILAKDFKLKDYQIVNKERYSLHSCARQHESTMGGFQGLWLWVYPNLGLPCYEPCYYTLQVNPVSATQTQLNYKFRFKESVTEREKREFIESIRKITHEDISVCEQVQKNLSVGVFREGYLHPERENGVAYFHSLLRESL